MLQPCSVDAALAPVFREMYEPADFCSYDCNLPAIEIKGSWIMVVGQFAVDRWLLHRLRLLRMAIFSN
jgi:hypothetical protein